MSKRYTSVADMAGEVTGDEKFAAELEEHIEARTLAKTLFAMRCAKGLTQKDMAEKLGCRQSRISKLENAETESIKMGDMLAYARALGLNMSIRFHKPMNAVED